MVGSGKGSLATHNTTYFLPKGIPPMCVSIGDDLFWQSDMSDNIEK
jgi:hypothetical protein